MIHVSDVAKSGLCSMWQLAQALAQIMYARSRVKAIDSTLHWQPRKSFSIISGAESAYRDNSLYSNTVEEPRTQAVYLKEILGLKLLK